MNRIVSTGLSVTLPLLTAVAIHKAYPYTEWYDGERDKAYCAAPFANMNLESLGDGLHRTNGYNEVQTRLTYNPSCPDLILQLAGIDDVRLTGRVSAHLPDITADHPTVELWGEPVDGGPAHVDTGLTPDEIYITGKRAGQDIESDRRTGSFLGGTGVFFWTRFFINTRARRRAEATEANPDAEFAPVEEDAVASN